MGRCLPNDPYHKPIKYHTGLCGRQGERYLLGQYRGHSKTPESAYCVLAARTPPSDLFHQLRVSLRFCSKVCAVRIVSTMHLNHYIMVRCYSYFDSSSLSEVSSDDLLTCQHLTTLRSQNSERYTVSSHGTISFFSSDLSFT